MILADTSVWVDHLRDDNPGLRELLEDGRIVIHPFVVGELACGVLEPRAEILSLLQSLPAIDVVRHEEILAFIEARRLTGRGVGLVDVHLLAAALIAGVALWTLDEPLERIAAELDVAPSQPE